ncbi:MAG TPA: four-carbon acid sugar kinase family protein, partial [Stenomitos sp.]
GPLGAEIAALRRDLGSALAVVAPAFPAAGRTTLGGYQLVNGVPVSLTSYGQDPLYPVTESHIPTLLAESGDRVGLVDWRTVSAGPEAIAAEFYAMLEREVRTVVVDAVQPADLVAVAAAIRRAPYRILPAGSAGLAAALCETRPSVPLFAAAEAPKGRLLGKLPPVFIVNGSANPVSLAQLQALDADVRKVVVDVRQLLLTDDEELERVARQVLQGLLAGKDVLLTTAVSPEQVRRDQELGTELGLSPFQVGHHLSEVTGRLVKRVVEQGELTHLVLVGGETAASVCAQLPGDRLEILHEVLPAIPCSQLVGTPLRIVTKSGGFGAPEALREIVTRMRLTGLEDESLRPRLR